MAMRPQGARTLFQLIEKIRCIYAVLANKITRCIFPRSCHGLYKSFWEGFESDQRRLTSNIAGYQICLSLLVWRVVNKTLKFRLTFLILLTINFPLNPRSSPKEIESSMTILETWDETWASCLFTMHQTSKRKPAMLFNNHLWSDSNPFQNDL